MKKLVLIIAILSVLCASGAYAQTQSGVVKTRGRVVNGKVVSGAPISGATVQVEGRQAILAKDGRFSFPVKNGKYTLKSVTKQGYQLVDDDACRQYQYSKNPLNIVMEQPDQLRSDQLAKERKLRRELQRRLQQREDEIEAMNIAVEEKNHLLAEVNQQREENEKIIESMAKYYSSLDYDQLDAFQQSVSALLEDCQLERADSLLRTRGDMHSRVSRIKDEQAAIAREQAELAKRKKALGESKAGTQRKLDAIAADCYNFYQRFFMAHQNDSAAYYLELRANLDTTNILWQEDAASFVQDYVADYEKALRFFNIALRQSLASFGDNSAKTAHVYSHIGSVFFDKRDIPTAMDYTMKALAIYEMVYGKNDKNIAIMYNSIGMLYSQQGDISKAMDYYTESLHIWDSVKEKDKKSIATLYSNIGYASFQKNDISKALEYHQKALDMWKSLYGQEDNIYVATVYNSIGLVYNKTGEMQKSIEYYKKTESILEKVVGIKHPYVASLYNNIGDSYSSIGEYAMAINYLNKSIDIRKALFGERSLQVAISYNNLGWVYYYQKIYEKALQYFYDALDILETTFGNKHTYVITLYRTLGKVYYEMKEYSKSLEWLQKTKSALEQLSQPNEDAIKQITDLIQEVKSAQLQDGQSNTK